MDDDGGSDDDGLLAACAYVILWIMVVAMIVGIGYFNRLPRATVMDIEQRLAPNCAEAYDQDKCRKALRLI